MKRLAIAAVALVAIPLALSATASTTAAPRVVTHIAPSAPPPQCTAKTFAPFADAVWNLIRWERGKPPHRVIAAQRRRLACAGPENRKAMQHRWREDKRAYYRHRNAKLEEREQQAAITPPGPEVLATIRACESGDDYSTNTGNGFYGAYQFDLSTWYSVGGSGLPSEASPAEQDYRAAKLYRSRGSSPWPVCGV